MSGTVAAFLLVFTFTPGTQAPDSSAIVQSWADASKQEIAVCADLANQQNQLFDFLYETGGKQGARQLARCEVRPEAEQLATVKPASFKF